MVVMYAQESVMIPQITLGIHTYGHIERPAVTCTLVVYAATLTLVTKGIPR